MRKGKLIVVESLDGAGGSTQVEMLCSYLLSKTIHYRTIHFPSKDTIYGEMIQEYLHGRFGALECVDPYFAGLMYTTDRLGWKNYIGTSMEFGISLVMDRYMSSSAYQVARLHDPVDKEVMRKWFRKVEIDENDMPEPDITIYLHTHMDRIKDNLSSRTTSDIHEDNLNYIRDVSEEYLYRCSIGDYARVDTCDEYNNYYTKEFIHDTIVELLKLRGII